MLAIIKYFGGKRNIVADALCRFKSESLIVKDIEKCENLVESFMVKTLSTTEKLNLKYIDDE